MMLKKKHMFMLRRVIARLLAFAMVFNATMLGNFISTPVAKAYYEMPDVILSEIIPGGSSDKIEFFSDDLIGDPLPEGWELSNEGGEAVNLSTLAEGLVFNEEGFLVIDLGSFFTDNRGDLVLTYNDLSEANVSWGNNLTADLPPAQDGNSLSRIGESGWFSNTSITEGALNSAPETLPVTPSAPEVLEGEGNPEDYINDSSKTVVSASANVDGFAHSLKIRFFGSSSVNPGFVTIEDGVGVVSDVDLSGLADAPISMRSFSRSSSGGVYSPWGEIGLATKDTVAPDSATFDFDTTYTNENPVSLDGSAEAGSTVNFYGWNGESAEDETATSVAGSDHFSFELPLDNLNGVNDFVAQVVDMAGNKSDFSEVLSVVHDDVAPVSPEDLEATHNKGFSTVTLDWVFDSTEGFSVKSLEETSSSPIDGFNIYSSQTGSFSDEDKIGKVDADVDSFTTTAFDSGMRYFVVTAIDDAGNESVYSTSVSVLVAGLKSEKTVSPGDTAIFSDQGLSMTPDSDATGDSTFTVVGYDNNLPGGEIPDGLAFLGNYFDVEVDNATAFPVNIKFYYTQAQLDAAGLEENQLQGIYFYDEASNSWMLYGDTGVSTADVDGTDFVGYVWANADHFTPIAIGGDSILPADVNGFHATSMDEMIKLTWDAVIEDAVGYIIRYRTATNDDDSVPYTEVYVDGASIDLATIKGLENGVLYEFNIWAQDGAGNLSMKPAVIVQTPGEEPDEDLVLPTKDPSEGVGGNPDDLDEENNVGGEVDPKSDNKVANNGNTDKDSNKPTKTKTDQDNTDVKGDQDSKEASSSSRALVTFLIIIAAGAAGFGGYYAYQWWIDRPTEKTEVHVTEKDEKKKKHHRNRRW